MRLSGRRVWQGPGRGKGDIRRHRRPVRADRLPELCVGANLDQWITNAWTSGQVNQRHADDARRGEAAKAPTVSGPSSRDGAVPVTSLRMVRAAAVRLSGSTPAEGTENRS
jgi:hypothetical protein